jgi:hypothetical protein
MKPLYIEWVESGVANRFDDGKFETIEMNRRLKDEPDLFYEILMHEVEHQEGATGIKDIVHDMRSKTPGLFKFMRKNPSTWIQALPIYWHKKRKILVYDWSSITAWMVLVFTTMAVYQLITIGMAMGGALS